MESQTIGQAGGAAGEAAAAAKGAARELASSAREVATTRAQGFFESNREAACARMEGMAQALRHASSEIGGPDGMSDAVRRVADRLEGFSRSLADRDLSGVLHEAERYARREPALFLGGALAAGFLLARFLKASGECRDRTVSVARPPA